MRALLASQVSSLPALPAVPGLPSPLHPSSAARTARKVLLTLLAVLIACAVPWALPGATAQSVHMAGSSRQLQGEQLFRTLLDMVDADPLFAQWTQVPLSPSTKSAPRTPQCRLRQLHQLPLDNAGMRLRDSRGPGGTASSALSPVPHADTPDTMSLAPEGYGELLGHIKASGCPIRP